MRRSKIRLKRDCPLGRGEAFNEPSGFQQGAGEQAAAQRVFRAELRGFLKCGDGLIRLIHRQQGAAEIKVCFENIRAHRNRQSKQFHGFGMTPLPGQRYCAVDVRSRPGQRSSRRTPGLGVFGV